MSVAFKQAKEGQGSSPKLLLELFSIRNRVKPTKELGSVRGTISELRELKTSLRGATEKGNARAAAELLIVNATLGNLYQISTEQTKAVAGLDQEVELFKDTMNLRLEYYRQLQQISDTVAPYEEDLIEEARNVVLLDKKASEARTKARIAALKSKGRYLVHLRDEATNVESQRLCIICQQIFEVGILTSWYVHFRVNTSYLVANLGHILPFFGTFRSESFMFNSKFKSCAICLHTFWSNSFMFGGKFGSHTIFFLCFLGSTPRVW